MEKEICENCGRTEGEHYYKCCLDKNNEDLGTKFKAKIRPKTYRKIKRSQNHSPADISYSEDKGRRVGK